MMRMRIKILLVTTIIFLTSFNVALSAESYQLGVKTGDSMIYEYSTVRSDLLQKLVDEGAIDVSYTSLERGYQYKLNVYQIQEDESLWYVDLNMYDGNELDQHQGVLYVEVYKDPISFAENIYGYANYYLVPIDIRSFLDNVSQGVDFYNYSDFSVGSSEIVYNYDNLTMSSQFENHGILDVFSMSYRNELAFKEELISLDITVEDDNILIIVVTVVSGLVFALVFMYLRKRKKKRKKSTYTHSYLRKIR